MLPKFVYVLSLILVVLLAQPVGAQTTQRGTQLPLTAFVEPAFGFELRVPAGWEYDRTRFQQFEDSIGLLRGHGPGGMRGLQIMVFRSFTMKPFEDWIIDFGKASAELMNSAHVDWETWKLPPRAGAILTYSTKMGGFTARTHYLCVPFDPHTVWVLAYTGRAMSEAEYQQVRAEFDEVIGTLVVRYDPQEAERLAPALDRGRELLALLREQGAKVRLDEQEQAYELVLVGKPIGYLTRRITREEYTFSGPNAKRRYAKDGVRVRERSWRFADDGTVRVARLDLFSSFDLRSELMESRQVQVPPTHAQPQDVLTRTEQVVREDDVLFASVTTSRDANLPDPGKPIATGPVYLDQAWVRLLPGLLLGRSEELHAVAAYNFETRALLSYQIRAAGTATIEGVEGPAYVFDVREGFIDQPSKLYTDERGTLLRMEAGELVLRRVAREELERKYGARRDEIRKKFGIGDE
jgi:hypothetical protein